MKNKITDILKPLVSIVLALLLGIIVIKIIGADPLNVYKIMLNGAFGNEISIGETLIKATTLILVGLSYAFAYKCGLINIGAEGQLYIGGACSAYVAINCTVLPNVLIIILSIASGFFAGGLWGAIVGWLKTKFDANEVITTVMFNYIAIYLVSYLVSGPMKDKAADLPQTAAIPEGVQLINILSGTRLHIGIIISFLCLILYGIYLKYTSSGYEMRIVGQNNEAAAYAGINVNKNVILAMFISGGFAGIGGAIEILGVQHRLLAGFSNGAGFEGIAVALLGGNNPIGMFFSSILFGALRSGGNAVQMFSRVPNAIINIIQAFVIIFVVMDLISKYKKKSEVA